MSRNSNLIFEKFMNNLNTNPIPLEFTNAVSTSEMLHILLDYIKMVSESAEEINDEIYKEFDIKFKNLSKDLENKVKDSALLDGYMATIYKFCTKYLSDMIADSLKYIKFELTDNGYFCAIIPDQWVDVIGFDTNLDSASKDYGKLIIQY